MFLPAYRVVYRLRTRLNVLYNTQQGMSCVNHPSGIRQSQRQGLLKTICTFLLQSLRKITQQPTHHQNFKNKSMYGLPPKVCPQVLL